MVDDIAVLKKNTHRDDKTTTSNTLRSRLESSQNQVRIYTNEIHVFPPKINLYILNLIEVTMKTKIVQ